ncbi:MAG TPA: type II secretion system secretin GspD [Phycisphaerae bacterium]|nr:type II secretion system secretin GspD [Phycisphaerae bacterium]
MTHANHSSNGLRMCAALAAVCLALAPASVARAQDVSTQPLVAEEPAGTQPVADDAATQPAMAEAEPTSAPATQPDVAAGEPTSVPSTQPDVAAGEPTTAPATQPAEDETASRISAPVPGEPLLLNFKDASVQAVLEYLSEAAGLVILGSDRVEGRVTVLSRTPVSTDEAVALLDTVLKDKGYAAIRSGRTLKIVSVDEAARENLPVHSGGDPDKVPLADQIITQVIPIRYADATRLRTDLAPLIGQGAKVTANQSSNALIVVDTQTNIRRIMLIIRALDEQMATVAEVKIYQLKYADATTTSRLITELLRPDDAQRQQSQRTILPFFRMGGRGGPGGGRDGGAGTEDAQSTRQQRLVATADDRTNTLVVTAPPEMLAVVDKIIEKLDSDPTDPQSVFIYPLKNAEAENVQAVLNDIFSDSTTGTRRITGGGAASAAGGRGGTSSRFGGRGGFSSRGAVSPALAAAPGDLAGQVYVVADADTNSLLVRTATKHVDRIKEILAELDRAIPQVLIKVLIAEVTHDDVLDLGTEFSALNLQFGVSGSIDVNTRTGKTDGGLVSATMDGGMSTIFNALRRQGRLDVLSRPYVLASDNQEASITVGQEVPFIRNSRTTEAGQIINTIEYEDVGIILTVTPHVNPEGLVIMDVTPEISSISNTTVAISGAAAMVYNKRSANTQVAVRDGQTIVIGGLMEDRIIDDVRKVPGLGDLPLLGPLFRRTNKSKVKTELLIFLTPRVANRPEVLPGISQEETDDANNVRQAGGNGAFDQHMKAMNRGGGGADKTEPATRPAGAVIEKTLP